MAIPYEGLLLLALALGITALVVGVLAYTKTNGASGSSSTSAFKNSVYAATVFGGVTSIVVPSAPGSADVPLNQADTKTGGQNTLEQVGGWTFNADGALVVPETGRYSISYQVLFYTTGDPGTGTYSLYAAIRLNGTIIQPTTTASRMHSTLSQGITSTNELTFVQNFSAGDTIIISVCGNSLDGQGVSQVKSLFIGSAPFGNTALGNDIWEETASISAHRIE